jgi:hypothetical protein
MSNRVAVVNAQGIVENIVEWDGVSAWQPCHETDAVFPVLEGEFVGPDFIRNVDGTYTSPTLVQVEPEE